MLPDGLRRLILALQVILLKSNFQLCLPFDIFHQHQCESSIMSEGERRPIGEIQRTVAKDILRGIENLIKEAESATRPLEIDLYRSRLFEFFVTADGAGLIPDEQSIPVKPSTDEDQENVLSSDNLCRILAQRWGLDMAAREAAATQTRMGQEQVERMRLLWSVVRMWMEWSYAWKRWAEFHDSTSHTIEKSV